MDWSGMIDAARAENANGVSMHGGKKYTAVAIRVEMMRRHAGDFGVETEIIQWAAENGQPIVVKATVRNDAGRILATGHAEEIRGKGNVNATSALENAETSAIGRALAALGLAGGEFASANEMDAVDRKSSNQPQAETTSSEAKANLMSAANLAALQTVWADLYQHHRAVADDPEVIAAKDVRKSQLISKEAA